eukprot:TRINITY_DN6580_c0_g1_i17.p2 TRINITY_DN6580_c0_g1~~TRINITY_DN6580_c0_g1_i17.p2  ORF type:complete len:141 (+),score=38.82 TRINITY_DN6580_c0_g1_i17:74-496(+)
MLIFVFFFFFQAEDGIRDAQESRGLGDVYKRQVSTQSTGVRQPVIMAQGTDREGPMPQAGAVEVLEMPAEVVVVASSETWPSATLSPQRGALGIRSRENPVVRAQLEADLNRVAAGYKLPAQERRDRMAQERRVILEMQG